MERQQTLDLITQYQKLLAEHTPERFPSTHKDPKKAQQLQHVRWMLDEMLVGYVNGDFSEGKVNRWLGFVQGVFWACGVHTIEAMREHNR